MKPTTVIELAIGRTKPEVRREAYLAAATIFEAGLRCMPGFRGRRLLDGEDSL